MGKSYTGSEILLESLRRQNVKVIFGLPGGAVLPLYDALYSAGIRHLLVRHEQAAAFAADGYARVTGKPGVCLVTSGPGATNLLTGLTSALMDSIPVVALTGQVPASLVGKDAFQEADTVGMALPSTKRAFMVRRAADIPAVIQQAFEIAISGRPGPVLVDLPKSVLLEKAEPSYPAATLEAPKKLREWNEADIRRAVDMIAASNQPLLYTGGGIISAGASGELLEFAELARIPVTTTLMGLGGFPSRHPLSLGMLGMHGSYATNTAVSHCDLMIAVGARFDDRVTGRIDGFAPNAAKIHLDVDPSEINKNVHVDFSLVGDAHETLQALVAEIKRRGGLSIPPERGQWLQRIESWKNEHPLAYDKYSNVIKPQYVIETVSKVASEDAIIAVDVGQHQMWAAQFYNFRQPRAWLSSSGLGTMGYGFPAAVGAQMAFPDRQVVAFVGDGGFQMTLNDLATIVQYRVPVKIAVINNRSLGMVRQWQEIFFEKRYCDIDLNFSPDFVKLAESYGIRSRRVEHQEDVEDAVRDSLSDREPHLIDFWVDPTENCYPIVPPGASLSEMVVSPPRFQAEEEVLDDLWAI